MGSSQPKLVELLAEIAERGEIHKNSLPQSDISGKSYFSGVGFVLSGVNYLVSLDEIHEIISTPKTTKISGAKHWLKGVANLRGILLSLVDLQEYFGRQTSREILKQRVLVLNQNESYLGLIVDEIKGLHHFEESEEVSENLSADAVIAPYIIGGFERNGELWRIFGMSELVESPEFHKVSV